MYKVIVSNISKSFGNSIVLRNVDLVIEPGELFFLLGPSGCGKTTLLRIITGFEQADSGTVFFNETNVTKMPPQKRNTSMVFQNYALWPHLTVRQNIAFGLETRSVKKAEIAKKVKDVLALVRMDQYADRFPNQLSGGQQQRIALARALVVHPELILLDEPLSNLDARLRAEMRNEIVRLHDETGITTIYVTHDQEEALSMADRIGFMDEGKLVQVGTPRELFRTPVNSRTGHFLGNANIIRGTVKTVGSQIGVETPLGVLQGDAGGGTFSIGESALCFFRPDVVDAGLSGQNLLNGTVLTGLYAGSKEHLTIESNGIQFQCNISAPSEPTRPGTSISCSVPVNDLRILKE